MYCSYSPKEVELLIIAYIVIMDIPFQVYIFYDMSI